MRKTPMSSRCRDIDEEDVDVLLVVSVEVGWRRNNGDLPVTPAWNLKGDGYCLIPQNVGSLRGGEGGAV